MPYYDWYETKWYEGLAQGYINSETFEIVIPAEEYRYAGHFTGNFAVVKKLDTNQVVINKENKKILKYFNRITLYSIENGAMVFALTENDTGTRQTTYNSGWPFYIPQFDPVNTIYRLYNLNTRKYITGNNEKPYSRLKNNSEYKPKIYFFENYMLYDNKLYKIENNGSIKESKLNTVAVIDQIIKERNLQFKEIDNYDNVEKLFSDYFHYNDTMNINLIIQNLPDNTQIKKNDKQPRVINRNIVYPFKIYDLLYEVKFESIDGQYKYIGLYNVSQNIWSIPTVEVNSEIYEKTKFISTEYDHWIVEEHEYFYYNLITRKKYYNLYIRNHSYSVDYFYDFSMVYRGYYARKINDIKNPIIIEDF
jgi:hypothetical protein